MAENLSRQRGRVWATKPWMNFITYRVLINHCCTSGLLDEAHKLLEEMKQTYWPKYITGYRNLIQGFSREFLASLGLLEEISKYDSVPLVPAYNILIDNLCKAGRLEKALLLLKEISSSISVSSAVIEPLYVSLIESLCLACEVEKAFELYTEMTSKGYVPELSLFVCLIKGLSRTDRWDVALQLSDSLCHMVTNYLYLHLQFPCLYMCLSIILHIHISHCRPSTNIDKSIYKIQTTNIKHLFV